MYGLDSLFFPTLGPEISLGFIDQLTFSIIEFYLGSNDCQRRLNFYTQLQKCTHLLSSRNLKLTYLFEIFSSYESFLIVLLTNLMKENAVWLLGKWTHSLWPFINNQSQEKVPIQTMITRSTIRVMFFLYTQSK